MNAAPTPLPALLDSVDKDALDFRTESRNMVKARLETTPYFMCTCSDVIYKYSSHN